MKIAVLGSGGWGSAISSLLASNGHNVYLWSRRKDACLSLIKYHENKEYLPGVILDKSIHFSCDLNECISESEITVLAVPSKSIRETSRLICPLIKKGQIILNISKGIEQGSGKRMSEVIKEEIPQAEIAVMSGPSHAEEVARKLATANVTAAENPSVCALIQEVFMNSYFRVYTSEDMAGVEIGGALKNVIALAAGIAAGLKCGDNAAAALMTRGIAEISNLGVKMGAKRETFSGLSGIGDLIVTCMSTHSRNRTCGVLIGQGMDTKSAIEKVHMVVEGYVTCLSAYQLSKKYNVTMPICECTYSILYENMPAAKAISMLMERDRKAEHDFLSGR